MTEQKSHNGIFFLVKKINDGTLKPAALENRMCLLLRLIVIFTCLRVAQGEYSTWCCVFPAPLYQICPRRAVSMESRSLAVLDLFLCMFCFSLFTLIYVLRCSLSSYYFYPYSFYGRFLPHTHAGTSNSKHLRVITGIFLASSVMNTNLHISVWSVCFPRCSFCATMFSFNGMEAAGIITQERRRTSGIVSEWRLKQPWQFFPLL